ncbi:MAG: hypothetical protein LBU34_08905 [Planctomycetaceae bacterium]|nr:hypothetical protein [Planctomycetaceae bacterium]
MLSASRQRNRYGEGLSPNDCLPFDFQIKNRNLSANADATATARGFHPTIAYLLLANLQR